jgi:aminoglycoside N3'-acetyltransferase
MREVTTRQLTGLLRQLGLQAGTGVMVHTALQFLGRPQAGLFTYLQALCQVLNIPVPSLGIPVDHDLAIGTLVVPTFNFAFARGQAYDRQHTPAEGMGVFSEYLRQLPEARRTAHPLQSLAAIGLQADELAWLDTPGAFDDGSAFERLLTEDYTLLLLGADIQAVSLLHYSEQRAQVPYRDWKSFTGLLIDEGTTAQATYRMYARDLELDPRLEIYPIQDLLQPRGCWRAAALNYGQVIAFQARDFVQAADELLAQDPWCFVTNPPRQGKSSP